MMSGVAALLGAIAPVVVTAGEHEGFSRLVVSGAQARDANVDGRLISIPIDATLGVNLDDVNRLRKAHRIVGAKVSADNAGARIAFRMTCDCVVEAAQGAGGGLVIDIRDPSPQPASPEAADHDDASLGPARARMEEILAGAQSSGYVRLHGEPVPIETSAETPPTGPPPVDTGEATLADCEGEAFLEMLEKADAAPSLDAIDALQAIAETAPAQETGAIHARLAAAYFALGFYPEAAATASPGALEGDGMLLYAAALAKLASGDGASVAGYFVRDKECSPLARALAKATSETEPAAPLALAGDELAALSLAPESLRSVAAERLAMAALAGGDAALAETLQKLAASETRSTKNLETLVEAQEADAGQDAVESLKRLAATSSAAPEAMIALAQSVETDQISDILVDDLRTLVDLERPGSRKARAALALAETLARSGALRESVGVYATAPLSEPEYAAASRRAARALLQEQLSDPAPASQFEAVDAYIAYRDFLKEGDDAPALDALLSDVLATLRAPSPPSDKEPASIRPFSATPPAGAIPAKTDVQSYIAALNADIANIRERLDHE